MNDILIDTNVLIYSTNIDSEFYDETKKFLKDPGYKFYTTSKNLIEYLSVVTRIPANPLDVNSALEIINSFKINFTILYPDENSFTIFENLVSKNKPAGLKLHDFEIASIALANNINTIFTYNVRDFSDIKEIKLFTT